MARWTCDCCGAEGEARTVKLARAEQAHHYQECPEYSRVEF